MVARLHERLEQAHVAPGVERRFAQHFEKQLRRHELAARAGDEDAARLCHLHAAEVQLLISAIGAVDGLAALGEGGRIADDQAVAPPFVGVGFCKVKDVGFGRGQDAVHTIQRGVAPDKRERVGRDVDRLDRLRAVERGVDGEAAGAAAEVEHGPALRVGLQAAPVFLLVEEVPGLLAVFDADEHSGVVLANFKFVRNCPVDAFFDLRETFLFADGDVVPLVDALRLK